MILQALVGYYERKPELPREGYELKAIPFVIELEPDGRVLQVVDTRQAENCKMIARSFLVPQGVKKSVNVAANVLWGNAEYVLALPDTKKLAERQAKGKEADYRARLLDMHHAFAAEIRCLPNPVQADAGVAAVLQFLEGFSSDQIEAWGEAGQEIRQSNPNLTFRLRGDVDLVCQRPAVVAALSGTPSLGELTRCLVTGEADEVERLHPSITGVRDAQSSGASLVSFNLDAFASFAKQQGHNAPVGKRAVFAYTTALKHLLRRDSPQKLQIGDATTVFWADAETPFENEFAFFFDEPHKDAPDPDRGTRAVAALFEAAKQGVSPVLDEQTRFFVLGLAPNAARIAIRFWHVGTVAQMAERIVRHFRDLEMVWVPDKTQKETGFLSITRLLKAIAAQEKIENVPPNLGGEVMRAILEGTPYPETLLHGAIRRIRAGELVSYPRAAILKACLNRTRNSSEEKIKMSLDPSNTHPGYRLGRLFAVLERIQEEAAGGHGKINATIRDRFYGAASGTPATVFPLLMRLKNHHLGKIENVGRRRNLESLLGEIINGLPPRFEPHLTLDGQGRFAVGYYQQRVHPSTYGKQGD